MLFKNFEPFRLFVTSQQKRRNSQNGPQIAKEINFLGPDVLTSA